MKPSNAQLRKSLLDACRILDHYGLLRAYGHASARTADGKGMLITPRKALGLVRSPSEMILADLDGNRMSSGKRARAGSRSKSKALLPLEYFLHTEVYRVRPDVRAICRTHGMFAQVMSVLRRPLRPVHELAVPLGLEVPIFDTPALISSQEIGRRMAHALGSAGALLLRGNGALVIGATVEEAVVNAIHMETSAEIQWRALCVGEPAWITGDEFSGEFARLAKREYEAVLRPWKYYLAKSRGR